MAEQNMSEYYANICQQVESESHQIEPLSPFIDVVNSIQSPVSTCQDAEHNQYSNCAEGENPQTPETVCQSFDVSQSSQVQYSPVSQSSIVEPPRRRRGRPRKQKESIQIEVKDCH